MKLLKIIAMALVVLVALPLAASASATVIASGSVTDGKIQAQTELTSEQYNDYMNVYGVHNSIMGKGTLTYNKYMETSPSYVKTAYSTLVESGRAIGSSANSILQATKKSAMAACCGDTATEPNTENCTPSTYTHAVTGSQYDISGGYVESYTDVSGVTIDSVVNGEATGTIGSYSTWVDMLGGCPDVSTESGTSRITVSGKIATLFSQFKHG